MYDCPDGGMVDTLVSGTRARKGVQVQVLFRAMGLSKKKWAALIILNLQEN